MTLSDYEKTDWVVLYKRLYVQAIKLAGGAAIVFDCGLSAEDMVNETFEKFFADPKRLGWTKKKGTLEVFLAVVLQNTFVDHVRRNKHVAGSTDDARTVYPSNNPQHTAKAIQNKLEYKDLVWQLSQAVCGKPELEDLLAAAELVDGHNVNQQLAEILDITVSEVVNLKKHFFREVQRYL